MIAEEAVDYNSSNSFIKEDIITFYLYSYINISELSTFQWGSRVGKGK